MVRQTLVLRLGSVLVWLVITTNKSN